MWEELRELVFFMLGAVVGAAMVLAGLSAVIEGPILGKVESGCESYDL